MKFKVLRTAITGLIFSVSCFLNIANAGLITKDYVALNDGLITIDTTSNQEWLDVSIFVGMNLQLLSGTNQWSDAGFRLASTVEIFNLYKNAGILYINDYNNIYDLGDSSSANAASQLASQRLYNMLGGSPANFGGRSDIHGLQSDADNDGNAYLARLQTSGRAAINTNGDSWGVTYTRHEAVGAFFVRDITDVPEPSTLAIFALGMIGLASRRFKKQY
ncbi:MULTISPECIES: PEP-CTERM sorting domain-containing protein [unclassified Colwellia]|uniref:PEP-CTERM sorting domain-containing protein n=1 Tax=unclassified Colwellia TaxID=196834 RepID=UPI0021750CED|nr:MULTISPECIES: PEP-CTERM sorting domain-containing protein [unclassified Colwellia]